MVRLIDQLPVVASKRHVALSPTENVPLAPFQAAIWVTVTPPQTLSLPATAPRFPALIDTGFTQTLLIQDRQLWEWGRLRAESLETFPGEMARFETQHWPFRMADIWLHPNVPGDQASALEKPAFCLEAHPGILVVSESQRKQTLPIIGMRALARNRLSVLLQFQNPTLGHLSIEA